MPSAYLVLTYTNEEGKRFVLAGQKSVMSYEAITKFKENTDFSFLKARERTARARLIREIKNQRSPIGGNGYVASFGKRFSGTLLPAGGKPTFFGGHLEPEDQGSLQRAAIREFRQEFDVNFQDPRIQEAIQASSLTEIHRTDWGGTYFECHLTEAQAAYLQVQALNQSIDQFEGAVNLDGLYQGGNPERVFLPEVRKPQWIPFEEAPDYFAQLDTGFLENQIFLYTEFLFPKLGLDAKTEVAQVFRTNIMEHILRHELIDGHQEVACQLEARTMPEAGAHGAAPNFT